MEILVILVNMIYMKLNGKFINIIMNKEILNEVQDKYDYPVRITFDVVCDSHTEMQEGETIKERIQSYIDDCADAMDDSMRHWGDHHSDIEPMKVEIWDEDAFNAFMDDNAEKLEDIAENLFEVGHETL